MSAYIAELNKLAVAPAQTQPTPTLRQRFETWFCGLPEFVRDRAFSMSEFETAMETQGKYISPVLLQLGWRRERVWRTDGQYNRYWLPPRLG